MGLPTIYYYPSSRRGFKRINFDTAFASLRETFEREADPAEAGDFAPERVDMGGRTRITIGYQTMDRALVAKLRTLITHLQKGLPISVAADRTKAWAAYVDDGIVTAGDTSVPVGPNAYYQYESVAGPSAADYVVMRGPNPEGYHEEMLVGAYSSRTITVSAGVTYDYSAAPLFVRNELFWPVMYLAPEVMDSDEILVDDRRLVWTLSLPLVEAPGDYVSLYSDYADGTAAPFGGEESTVLIGDVGVGTLQGAIEDGRMTDPVPMGDSTFLRWGR